MNSGSVRLASDAPMAQASRGRAAGGRRFLALTVACFVVSLVVMPFVYVTAAFHADLRPLAKIPVVAHIFFNCTANLAVLLSARGFTGRLDQRVSAVFSRVLLFHGILAFLTLIFRSYYSIPMLLIGVFSSSLLGAAVVLVQSRLRPLKIGVLGPWHPMLRDIQQGCELLASPDADIRRYDLLVTTFVDDLSEEWTPALSRALLAGRPVRHAAQFLEEAKGVVSIEHFHIDHLPEGGLSSYRVRKRILELLVVIIAFPLALIALGAGCLVVLTTMGRPIFFVQRRVGQSGRVFQMFKLRTMNMPRPVEAGTATLRGDPRVTPAGRWLRRFHIDELPQLWNVLVGDMSIVGPRPEQPALAETYRAQLPAFAYRQMVRPGITGWAQVRTGYAADLGETRVKLGYDLFYLKNFSFALDLQILARTLATLLAGGGVR